MSKESNKEIGPRKENWFNKFTTASRFNKQD
jgi:hypothetical protein